jgi:hypothetical protein
MSPTMYAKISSDERIVESRTKFKNDVRYQEEPFAHVWTSKVLGQVLGVPVFFHCS